MSGYATMLYKLRIKKQIHGCFASASSADEYMYRDFILPFAPTLGLRILDDKGNEFSLEHELYWDIKNERFLAYEESDKEIYNANLHHHDARPIMEIVKEYEESGWKHEK